MAKIVINERERAAIAFRLAGVTLTDIPTRRKVDRLFDALDLDNLPADAMDRLNHPSQTWKAEKTEFSITSEQRDNLIDWLTPTERMPMNGFMGRVLGPVYDTLKESRDGKTSLPENNE